MFQRADGRWAAQVDVGWKNGRRQRKLLYGRTRREVQDQLRAALKTKQEGMLRAGPRQMTGQFLRKWLEDSVKPSVRPATYSMYWHLTTRHLIPNLERIPLAKLSPEHVQELLVVDQGTKKVADADGFAEVEAALGGKLRIINQANLGTAGSLAVEISSPIICKSWIASAQATW